MCDIKENATLSVDDKTALREWRLSHPDEFCQSKKRVLDTRKSGNRQHKRQKRNNFNNNSEIKPHIQAVTNSLINARIVEINKDDTKKVSFKVSDVNAEA